MNKHLTLLLPLLALLVTGCPRNEYTVNLTPHGDKLQRELVFYRVDGTNKDGTTKYEGFTQEELEAITHLYPQGAVTSRGDVLSAKGDFAGALPSDVGGAGNYTNLATSLGSAGFYAERFRGNDDLAGQTEKRLRTADQLTDIIIGWSKAELGGETNYEALHKFLDTGFRSDVKNAAVYWNQAGMDTMPKTNNAIDYSVRFAQYLIERGYFKLSDAPGLFLALGDSGSERFMGFIQRLVARKLGVDDSQPVPVSLAFLHDDAAMEKSFEKYFTGTELYRNKVKVWQEKHEAANAKPDVAEIMMEQFSGLFEFNLFGDPPDHLSVKLSLSGPPIHTNGKWDETNHAVVWNSDLEGRTNAAQLPVLCYASWAQPAEEFQKQHFGRVILVGDDLAGYCLWHAALNEKQGMEWDKLLAGLKPDDTLKQKIKDLRLSDEPPATETKDEEKSLGYLGRGSLENALDGKNLQGGSSDASKSN